MATTLKFRRGNKATSDAFTGSQAELFINTEENRLVVHDGSTTGGFPVTKSSELSSANTWLQANDAITLTAAHNYTDSANSWLRANDATTLTAAKSYTDTANSYLGGLITTDGTKTQAAFDKANTAYSAASDSYNYTTQVDVYAQSAYAKANSDATLAQAAYDSGNTTLTYAQSSYAKANADGVLAQAAYDSGNTTLTYSQTGFAHANAAYNKANTVASDLSTANTWLQANDATTLAASKSYTDTSISNLINSAPDALNTLKELADALADDPNFATTITTSVGQVRNHANSAYDKANTNASDIVVIQAVNTTQNTNISASSTLAQAAFDAGNTTTTYAQSAYAKANADGVLAQAAFDAGNTTLTYAQSGYAKANAANVLAQASFDHANLAITIGNTATYLGGTNTSINHLTSVGFNTTAGFAVGEGEISWNATDRTFDMGLYGGSVLQVGQETHMLIKANNNITNGQTVMFVGANGGNILGDVCNTASPGFSSSHFIGVATQNITKNDFGYITVYGLVHGLTTNGYSVGDILWVDNTTPGALTTTPPSAGTPHIQVAAVTKSSGGDGHIMVRPTIYPSIEELSNFDSSFTSKGMVLEFNGSIWTPSSNVLINQAVNNTQNTSISYAFAHANSAYDTANVKFNTAGGTITGDTTITANLSISGNLTVTGNVTTTQINNVSLANSIIYLAKDNPANTIDIGVVGSFTQGSYQHTGVVRDNADGKWKFFSNVIAEPTETVDFTGAVYDTIKVGGIESPTATINGIELGAYSSAAYAKANADGVLAQAAFDAGNTTTTYAQAGFSLANTNSTLITGIQAVNSSQNTSISDVNALAQAAYNSGNTTITYSQSGYAKANAANVLAQASYDRANTILSLTEDTTTNGGFFPIFTDSTSGTITSANVSYGLSYNPSQQRLDVGTFLSINGNTSTITAANLILSGTNISEKLQASYDSGNTTLIYAQSGYNKANTVASDLSTANTFLQANDATTLASAKSYADTLITNLVNSAPTTLDTLKELADALGDDPNFATTITTSIGQVRNHANGAFDKANTAASDIVVIQAVNTTQNTNITNVTSTAGAGFNHANSAYDKANTTFTYASSGFNQANVAFAHANSAYNTANVGNSFVTSGGYVGGQVTATSLSANTSVTVNTSVNITSTVLVTSTTTANQVADSFSTSTYRSAKYEAQITSGSSYHVIELRVLHDGTTVLLNQYGEMFTGSSLGTFDATISTGNLQLLFTPTNSVTTVKLLRNAIAV